MPALGARALRAWARLAMNAPRAPRDAWRRLAVHLDFAQRGAARLCGLWAACFARPSAWAAADGARGAAGSVTGWRRAGPAPGVGGRQGVVGCVWVALHPIKPALRLVCWTCRLVVSPCFRHLGWAGCHGTKKTCHRPWPAACCCPMLPVVLGRLNQPSAPLTWLLAPMPRRRVPARARTHAAPVARQHGTESCTPGRHACRVLGGKACVTGAGPRPCLLPLPPTLKQRAPSAPPASRGPDRGARACSAEASHQT